MDLSEAIALLGCLKRTETNWSRKTDGEEGASTTTVAGMQKAQKLHRDNNGKV
jgi:hypothetical protein